MAETNLDLMQAIFELEENDTVHEGRLLILLRAFSTGQENQPIEGLTKLAKLDFLLRYPTYLERALVKKGRSTKSVDVQEHERVSVESKMVRYRFGPWDHRYRRILNLLVGKGLVTLDVSGRTINIGLTPNGHEIAESIATAKEYSDIANRAKALKSHFNIKGTNLMKFIYKNFVEIVSLRSNQEIDV